jgi:signal transduction histidine kinase
VSKATIILFFFYSVSIIFGSDLDSLKIKIEELNGRDRVDYINSIVNVNSSIDEILAEELCYQALEISTELSYNFGSAEALMNLGDQKIKIGSYQNAIQNYFDALNFTKGTDDKNLKADLIFKIGLSYQDLDDYSKSTEHFLEALNIFRSIEKSEQIFYTLKNIADNYSSQREFETAREYYNLAVENTNSKISDSDRSDLQFSIGTMYFNWGNLDRSLKHHQKALELRHEIKDDTRLVNSLNRIGLIYLEWKKLSVAEDFFLKASSICKRLNSKVCKANSFINLAKISRERGNFNTAEKGFDSALELFESINDSCGIQKALSSLGELNFRMGKNYKALEHFKELLTISSIRNDKANKALAFYSIGLIYKKTNSEPLAVDYFLKSIETAKSDRRNKLLIDNYSEISSSYEAVGDLENALKYSKLYASIKDSLISDLSISRMAEVKSNKEMRKSRKEIETLQQNNLVQALELESQSKQRNFLFFVTVVVILISSFVYYRYYIKSKTNEVIMAQRNKLDLLNKELNRKNTYLTESESKLKYLNGTKDKFFSIISHDLKNPFSTLMGYTDLLSEYFDDFSDEEKKSIINEVQNSTHRAYALLENLLQWSKSQRGELKMLPERIDLSIVVSDNITNLYEEARKKDISLKSEINGQTYVLADYNTISSVVKNLLSNSIKFTNEGGSVNISAKDNGDHFEIIVSDNGVSISEEDMNKLFRIDVHHTTIGASADKGTGLGLVLCKEFVEKNGGKIWVESESGKGSDFKFTIPKYNA